MRYQETLIQEMVVRWAKNNYPDIVLTSAPAVAKNARQGVRNKKMGYCKGWPDLFFAEPRKGFFGLFVELKTETGRIDEWQRSDPGAAERSRIQGDRVPVRG